MPNVYIFDVVPSESNSEDLSYFLLQKLKCSSEKTSGEMLDVTVFIFWWASDNTNDIGEKNQSQKPS